MMFIAKKSSNEVSTSRGKETGVGFQFRTIHPSADNSLTSKLDSDPSFWCRLMFCSNSKYADGLGYLMLFAVIFKDKFNTSELRQLHLAGHLAWLDLHKDLIRVGGSLRSELNQTPLGGLWIVESDSKKTILDLIETDPFWMAGLRQSVDIFHWSKAFAERKSLI